MRGNVELTASDGLVAKTEAASYSQNEGILRAPGPATFSRARMSGSSVGLTYDESRDVMWLLDHAVMKMAPETPETPPVDITAGAADFARADHYVRYERGFTLVSGPRMLSSALATAFLTARARGSRRCEMRGNAESPASARARARCALWTPTTSTSSSRATADARGRDAREPPPRAGVIDLGRRRRRAARVRAVDRRAVRDGRVDGQLAHRARVGRADAARHRRRAAEHDFVGTLVAKGERGSR